MIVTEGNISFASGKLANRWQVKLLAKRLKEDYPEKTCHIRTFDEDDEGAESSKVVVDGVEETWEMLAFGFWSYGG